MTDESPPSAGRVAEPAGLAERLVTLLAGNARALAAAGFVAKLATLSATVVLARGLGEQQFGRYIVAIAFASLLGVFVEFGTSRYLVREVARNPRVLGRTTGLVLLLRAVFGVTAVAAAFLLPPLLGYPRETSIAIALFTAAAAVRALGATFLAALQARERLGDVAAVQAQQALLAASATICVIALGGRLIAVSWVALAVAVVSVPWSWRRLNVAGAKSIEFSVGALRDALPVVVSFSGVVLFSTAITYVDSLLVNAFEGDDETALYGAAYQLLLATYFIPTVYGTALVRSMSHLAVTDRDTMAWLYSRVMCHLTVAALPLAICGLVGSRALLQIIYGEPYTDADKTLALLLLSVVFTFPAWIASTTTYAAGGERRIVAIVAASFTLNITANLFAIPAWGIEGAAAINVATEALTLALLLFVLRRLDVRLDWFAAFGKPLMAVAPAAVLVFALTAAPLSVRLIAGGAAYVAALLFLRTFDAHDAAFVRSLGRFDRTGAQVDVER